MTKAELYKFLHSRRFGVMASVSPERAPQAALIGYAITPEFEIIFDTTDATRKYPNLRANPKIALVIGWEDPGSAQYSQTVQYEGIADEPKGAELERLQKIYFEAFPEHASHREWPGITWFRVRPRWIRHSSYYRPRSVSEFSF